MVLGWRVKHKGQGRLRLGRVTRRVLLADALCDCFYSIVPLAMLIISFLQIDGNAYGSWNGTYLDRRIEGLGGDVSWKKRDYRNCKSV